MLKSGQHIERTLRYELTRDDQHALGQTLARAQQDLEGAQDRKKEVTAQLAAEVKAAEGLVARYAKTLAQGYDYRKIDCVVTIEGMNVSLTRADTGELVQTRALTPDESEEQLRLWLLDEKVGGEAGATA